MSHNLLIRKAHRLDLPHIHALVHELAVYEKAESAFTATLEHYQRDFDEGWFHALVAELDGKVVGMALYYVAYSTWKGRMVYLEDFVVKEEFRSLGLGQQLWDALLDESRLLEARLVKWQVLDWNEPAVRFYKRQEAIIEQEWWNGKLFL